MVRYPHIVPSYPHLSPATYLSIVHRRCGEEADAMHVPASPIHRTCGEKGQPRAVSVPLSTDLLNLPADQPALIPAV